MKACLCVATLLFIQSWSVTRFTGKRVLDESLQKHELAAKNSI